MSSLLPLAQPFSSPGDLATEAPLLKPAALDALAAWAENAAPAAQAPEWRRQGQRWLEAKQAGAVAHVAYALLLERMEERAEATRQLLVVCDRLSQVGAWEAVEWVAAHLLEGDPSPAAARWLVRAAEERDGVEAVLEALRSAHDAAPGDAALGWRLAQLLEERGEHEEAIRVTAEALEAMVRRKDLQALDEIYLFLLESPRRETLRHVFPAFPLLAKSSQVSRLADYLSAGMDAIRATGAAPEAWAAVREALLAAESPAPLLRLLPPLIEAAHPAWPEAVRVLELSGLLDGEKPSEALAFFDRALPFSPGAFVEHNTWGAGRVLRLERDNVWIDFPGRPGHRMSLRAAQQALVPVGSEDLAVLASSTTPEELARRAAEDPVDLVARALARSKGEAELSALKRVLVHYAIPEKEWSRFWKAAKPKLESDPRLDVSQAYRGVYRLAPAGGLGEAAEVPRFDRGADPHAAIAVYQRFLAQHPDRVRALLARNAATLERWREDDTLSWRTRFDAASLLALEASPAALGAAEGLAARAFEAGFDLRELPTAADQARVLGWGLATGAWSAAARSAFGSRFAEIREEGLSRALERHGEAAQAFLEKTVVVARAWPDAALQISAWAFGARGRPAGFPALSPWPLAVGMAELLEAGPTTPQAKVATALFELDGALLAAARISPPSEDALIRLRRLVSHWRSSDRLLHPLLAWLEAAGQGGIADEGRNRRRQAARAVTANATKLSPYDVPQVFLTRATYERLRREAEDVQQALRTTIPAAIQKARELGDLRENAEYESARLKQRQAQARLEQLGQRMERALFIDDQPEEADTVGLGSEVTLEVTGAGTRRVWLLGEGDAEHGEEVVSYLAPMGRTLYGRATGDTVDLPADGETLRATIRSTRRRLPHVPERASPAGGTPEEGE